jgi:hypothetical protein
MAAEDTGDPRVALPPIDTDKFEEMADDFAEREISVLKEHEIARGQYVFDQRLKDQFKQSFHRYMSKRHSIVEPDAPSPQ